MRLEGRQGVFFPLREEEGFKFVHEAIIEGGKILQAFRAGFLQFLKKEDLAARVQLLKELAELSHGIATRGETKNIMDQSLDELLFDILAIKVAVRELP